MERELVLYSNSSFYEGEFKYHRRHGKGTYNYADGQKYVGEWKENKRMERKSNLSISK